MPTHPVPSSRTLILSIAAIVAVLATALAACGSSEIEPPAGWEAVAEDRWVRTGADVTDAFRDLSTVEAMGVADTTDEVTRYAKEQLLYLYRSSPEVVDSLFQAEARPLLERAYSRDNYREEIDEAINEIKVKFLGGGGDRALYNLARAMPDPPPQRAEAPDSLQSIMGEVAVQVLVDRDGQAVAVQAVDGLHPTLDKLAMLQAATTRYNAAWVITGPRGGGQAIPNYVRLVIGFG